MSNSVPRGSIFKDKDWVRDIFLVGQDKLDGMPWEARTWSTADFKFVDTGIGGSLVVNPLPQPCLFTDPVNPNGISRAINNDGLGPFFSETFDDNYRIVSFRLGTMSFTSLAGFLLGMYHPGAGNLVNKGRVDKLLFGMGKLLGTGVRLMLWPVVAANLIARGISFLMRKPTSRYAYLKPAMPMYWSAVQTIVNHFMVNSNLVFRGTSYSQDGEATGPKEGELGYSQYGSTEQEILRNMYPDLYGNNFRQSLFIGSDASTLDVYVAAGRAQRLANARLRVLEEIQANGGMGSAVQIRDLLKQAYRRNAGNERRTLANIVESWMSAAPYNPTAPDVVSSGEQTSPNGADLIDSTEISSPSFLSFLDAEMTDGTAFVNFRVDDTGSVSETFNNSYKSSSLAEKINSMSSTARSTFFDTAGGNLGDGVLSNLLESAMSGLKSLAEGAIEGMGLSGLLIAGGGGTVDMPKYWESSEVQLPRPGYTFNLTARYANRRSVLQDVIYPLACIMAIAIPRSVGKHSHSSPMYFEFYDKGRMQSRLAAIDSLTITRGDGNMGFTPDGKLMSVTVSFTIVPMEETLAMPISETFSITETIFGASAGALLGAAPGAAVGAGTVVAGELMKGLFDDDTPFMDYMAVLAGLGVNEQHYLSSKLKRRLAFNRVQAASAFSTARMASLWYNDAPLVSGGLQVLSSMFWSEKAEL